jgi:hypothetical protein
MLSPLSSRGPCRKIEESQSASHTPARFENSCDSVGNAVWSHCGPSLPQGAWSGRRGGKQDGRRDTGGAPYPAGSDCLNTWKPDGGGLPRSSPAVDIALSRMREFVALLPVMAKALFPGGGGE